uniref:Uncharacterized protein n=1 Tax=Oryza meridionalis TaxID=40149 RepID=A0A0E0C536_9ORYZ
MTGRVCSSRDPAKWFVRCVQKMEARSFFQGMQCVPQVNMPMFPTDMNDQWHGAFTYNTALHLRGVYQMSINENSQPQGPSFLEMLGQGDWLFSQPPIMQPQTIDTNYNLLQNILYVSTLQLSIPCFVGMYTADQMMGYAGST